jgi:hypothetical protein
VDACRYAATAFYILGSRKILIVGKATALKKLARMSATGQSGTKFRPTNCWVMFVNSIPVDVVGDAYHIAANYLKQSGRIPDELDIHQPLLDSIVEDFRAGKKNKLILANRAIARFEKAADALELIS